MIWLIGCNGNLGSEIAQLLKGEGVPFYGTDSRVDVSEYEALKAYAADKSVEWIINCAAYTDVDKAEDDRERAFSVNETGARNCALIARERGARLIHISTDYVFDGNTAVPLSEEAPANPLSVYGKSKEAGEQAVREVLDGYYIIRTSWLYGRSGRNFVNTMLRVLKERPLLKVVVDQKGNPAWARDIASVILQIIEKDDVPFGTYNCSNSGETTWYDFACTISEEAGKKGLLPLSCAVLEACTSEEYAARAKRPAYSVLSKEKICRTLGISMPDWKDSLICYLESLCDD